MKNTLLNCSIAPLLNKKQSNNEIMKQSARGFTLIELLVTIAIIGLLATFLIPNYIEARVRARDAQRKSDLRTIQTALEAYQNDHGEYPDAPSDESYVDTALQAALVPRYMRQLPHDPLENDADVNARYNYDNVPFGTCGFGGTTDTYRLFAWLENVEDNQGTDECGDKNNKTLSSTGNRLIYTVISP